MLVNRKVDPPHSYWVVLRKFWPAAERLWAWKVFECKRISCMCSSSGSRGQLFNY